MKPFIGDRKIQELELSIKATISTIYSELNKKMGDALKTVSNPKFYYPMVNPPKSILGVSDRVVGLYSASRLLDEDSDGLPDP